MQDWTKFLKIKYKKHCGNFKYADCYGFANLILREIYHNYKFPDYVCDNNYISEIKAVCNANDIAKNCGITKIDLLKTGCFVRMDGESGFGSHCGIYIGDNKIIHIDSARGARIEDVKYLRIVDCWE